MKKKGYLVCAVSVFILIGFAGQVKSEEQDISYRTHVRNIGWQKSVSNEKVAGTTGKALSVEALEINKNVKEQGDIRYSTHVRNIGWQNFVSSGTVAGTTGKALSVEGIKIVLTGEMIGKYDIFYRTHVRNIGWQPFVKNGEVAGTVGKALPIEALQIKLVKKGTSLPEEKPEEKPKPPVEKPEEKPQTQEPVVNVKQKFELIQGDVWDNSMAFISGTDEYGKPLSFNDISVSGVVNTNSVGSIALIYQYKNIEKIVYVNVKFKIVQAEIEQQMLAKVNELRRSVGKKELVLDPTLSEAATFRAKELETLYGHTRPNGLSFSSVYREIGYSWAETQVMGENIASEFSIGQPNVIPIVDLMFDGWKESAGHYTNMVTNYERFGFGLYHANNNKVYGVQWFAR